MTEIGDSVLTIIPARSGSKGVLSKNTREMCGRRLIEWVIDAVKGAEHTGRVIISTDSPEILAVGERLGVKSYFLRPAEISGDFSTDLEFIMHALDFFKKQQNWQPKIVARLSPSTPFVSSSLLDSMITHLVTNPSLDSVRAIFEPSHHPLKSWRIQADLIEPAFAYQNDYGQLPHNLPRQELPALYQQVAAAGVAWSKTHFEYRSTSGPRVGYVFASNIEGFDINNEFDFEIACFLADRHRSYG